MLDLLLIIRRLSAAVSILFQFFCYIILYIKIYINFISLSKEQISALRRLAAYDTSSVAKKEKEAQIKMMRLSEGIP